MSLTTTIATVVQRGGIFGSHSPPSDQPAVPTGRFDDLPDDNPHHITKAAAVAISVSSVSLILSAFMIYWFVRMRRRYRHEYVFRVLLTTSTNNVQPYYDAYCLKYIQSILASFLPCC